MSSSKHTPFPWVIGPHGVIAPSVTYEESRQKAWDDHWRKRHPNSRQPGYDSFYGGELVLESCSEADSFTIVCATRKVDILLQAIDVIARESKDPRMALLAGAVQAICHRMEKTVRQETAEAISMYKYRMQLEEIFESHVYMLPEFASRERPIDPYQPTHKFVTDNIETAWDRLQDALLQEKELPF